MSPKPFFVVTDEYENTGLAVVADSLMAGMEIVREELALDQGDPLSGWEIEGDHEDIPVNTIVEGVDGLKRGFYRWVEDQCPLCGKMKKLVRSEEEGIEGLICCLDCEDRRIDELIRSAEPLL